MDLTVRDVLAVAVQGADDRRPQAEQLDDARHVVRLDADEVADGVPALEQDEQASAHVIQEPLRAEGDEQDDERPAAEGRGRVFDEDADDREDRDEDDAVAELDQSLRVLRAARGELLHMAMNERGQAHPDGDRYDRPDRTVEATREERKRDHRHLSTRLSASATTGSECREARSPAPLGLRVASPARSA